MVSRILGIPDKIDVIDSMMSMISLNFCRIQKEQK